MAGRLVNTASRKLLISLAVTGSVLLFAAAMAKPASRDYLRSHHSTTLSSLIVLLAPPPDLFAPLLSTDVRPGATERVQLQHRYAGGHMVIGRFRSAVGERIEGRLNCGQLSISLHNGGSLMDRGGIATNLSYYVVDGNLVGLILECDLVLAREGRHGTERIEVAKISDL